MCVCVCVCGCVCVWRGREGGRVVSCVCVCVLLVVCLQLCSMHFACAFNNNAAGFLLLNLPSGINKVFLFIYGSYGTYCGCRRNS